MSLKNKLNRYKHHLNLKSEDLEAAEPKLAKLEQAGTINSDLRTSIVQSEIGDQELNPETEIPFRVLWQAMQANPIFYDGDYVMVREIQYPLDTRWGHYLFSELETVSKLWKTSGVNHPLSIANKSISDLIFFDTETTGLHGGTGNTIFLLGFSRLEQEGVRVKQFFLPSPHAEAALYQAFLQEIAGVSDLVTFNGKAFDWPQVKTRHTLLRNQVPQLPTFGHFDLLHASRRLWKEELESCRLGLVERERLGIRRNDDTPGHLAPILYFDYLKDQNPSLIEGVLKHNEWDVLSLITLYIHISYLLLRQEPAVLSDNERFQIGRWYDALGEWNLAAAFFETLLNPSTSSRIGNEAKKALAHLYKKQKKWDQAVQLWEKLCQETSGSSEVFIELSKIYEHAYKDPEKALYYAALALERSKVKTKVTRSKNRQEQGLHLKRIERLEQKCSKFTGNNHPVKSFQLNLI